MSEDRWIADRVLTIEMVGHIVSEQFRDLDPSRLEFLGSGWDNDVYLLNEEWVFRFPRRREVADRLEYEAAVASCFDRRLAPVGVRVATVQRWGHPCEVFPYAFGVSQRMPGEGADRSTMQLASSPSFTKSMGEMLGQLHATRSSEVPALPDDLEGGKEWLAEAVAGVEDLCRWECADMKPYLDWLVREHEIPTPAEARCVIHNDLCPDHVFVSRPTGRVVGLIDISDASWGDPVLDFTILPGWLGSACTREVIHAYPHPLDDEFTTRLRFSSRLLTLKWLHDAHQRGGDLDKHRAWVHNAFRF